ncbi:hypothetical protein D4764_08G0003780 [Takifugu flavidus]|uniref:Uncharacterized protein n=1 Tax=Takifugu flavidus TaxID=433684 RepID=A0A5C6MQF4_9TELE|nr:hypothetical protein D4764_08G0003780 [Takifugu flavidus]
MDPLMPSLCILDMSVPQDGQQCILKASKEVRDQSKPHQPTDDSGLRCLKTPYDEARRRCRLVTQNPSEVQWMGQLILTGSSEAKASTGCLHQFDSPYSARWGNALFGHTNGDPSESSLVQKLKFSKRRWAAHLLGSRKNRLVYCFVQQLWLVGHRTNIS